MVPPRVFLLLLFFLSCSVSLSSEERAETLTNGRTGFDLATQLV